MRNIIFGHNSHTLFQEIQDENITSLKKMIENGTTDVNIVNEEGMTPLYTASYRSKLEIVKILL